MQKGGIPVFKDDFGFPIDERAQEEQKIGEFMEGFVFGELAVLLFKVVLWANFQFYKGLFTVGKWIGRRAYAAIAAYRAAKV